ERLWRWSRRNPAVATMTASVLLLLVFIAVGASISAVRLDRERDRAVTAEREGRDKLFEAYVARARAGRLSQRVGQRFDSLDALVEARKIRPEPQLQTEAIACLAL